MAFPFLRPFIPDSLFGRFLLIIVLPMVLVQLIAAYVFYERHWNSVSRHMGAALAGEVAMLTEILEEEPASNQPHILDIADKNLYVKAWFIPQKTLLEPAERHSSIERFADFHHELSKLLSTPFTIHSTNDASDVEIQVQLASGVLHILTTNKRLENQTTYIFMLWMTGSATLLLVISILFMKNQIRAITRLATAAEKFGKGLEINDFKPEGAKEVLQASLAFIRMKERIKRQVTKRTEMLAGVSHDLRTPLTRMKLQLTMLGESEEIVALQEDVSEMEKMITEYLDFVRGEGTEAPTAYHIPSLLKDLVAPYQLRSGQLHLTVDCDTILLLRPRALKRAITNILENALRFAKQVDIHLFQEGHELILTIEDDGPGIPEEEYSQVFKPFYRIDRSRNLDTGGGVGLGMTIARDIISNHGGDITLGRSTLNGLRVTITLPL